LEADFQMAHLKDAPESQFAYVVVVARRARQLLIGGRAMVDNPKSRRRIAEGLARIRRAASQRASRR
jgi:DNA-directed RNA polymerase subunit K/omega